VSGDLPRKVVIHKTSRYTVPERHGFEHILGEFENRGLATITQRGILRWTCFGLAVATPAASIGLLIGDSGMDTPARLSMAVISAAPLFLAGASFLVVQSIVHPTRVEWLRNVILAATFLLWGRCSTYAAEYNVETLGQSRYRTLRARSCMGDLR
jgi:hypothetical protein